MMKYSEGDWKSLNMIGMIHGMTDVGLIVNVSASNSAHMYGFLELSLSYMKYNKVIGRRLASTELDKVLLIALVTPW